MEFTPSPPPPSVASSDDDRKRLLIVDDEADVRDLLACFLEADFDVETAPDGPEALSVLGRQSFDAILLDVMMPKMDGVAVIQKLRDLEIDVPVILTSAHPRLRDLAAKHGVAAVAKPIDLDVLLEALGRATGTSVVAS